MHLHMHIIFQLVLGSSLSKFSTLQGHHDGQDHRQAPWFWLHRLRESGRCGRRASRQCRCADRSRWGWVKSSSQKGMLTGAERREWTGMGIAGITINSYEMDHSLIPC